MFVKNSVCVSNEDLRSYNVRRKKEPEVEDGPLTDVQIVDEEKSGVERVGPGASGVGPRTVPEPSKTRWRTLCKGLVTVSPSKTEERTNAEEQ